MRLLATVARLLVVSVVVLAGCGSDADSEDDAALSESEQRVVETLEDRGLDRQVGCVAKALVDEFGEQAALVAEGASNVDDPERYAAAFEECGVDETPEDASPEAAAEDGRCDDESLHVPAPEIVTTETTAKMDLLYVEHGPCGYNADGAVNVGDAPSVTTAVGTIEVHAEAGFDAEYSVASEDSVDGSLVSAGVADAEGIMVVDVPENGCHQLAVELSNGDLSGVFVSRVQASAGACPPS